MSWIEHHTQSELFAAEAEVALRRGDADRARELYGKAAEAETSALQDLDTGKSRTFGISAVSAVSLWYKGKNLEQAQTVAYKWLASSLLPSFAVEQLKGLLQAIWNETTREKAGLRFAPGQVLVSIKGGEIMTGGAPLDLIVEKVQTVEALFWRTMEYMNGAPHRKHGPPVKEIQETCRPWLFQVAPGSYQFEVAIQEQKQPDLFDQSKSKVRDIAAHFLEILRAGSEDPETALPQIVPDKEYRTTFLKLTRNLAPSGKSFQEMELSSPTVVKPITLVPSVRDAIRVSLRKEAPPKEAQEEAHEETVQGVLRGVHLDKDWLEISLENTTVHIENVGAAVDDVIGPMVNRPVIVKALKNMKGHYIFKDIEPQE